MRIFIHWDGKDDEELTHLLVGSYTWSGSRLQVARQLSFAYVQDDRDKLIPNIVLDNGYTIYGYDEADTKLENPIFVGNVYEIEKDRQSSRVSVLARDHLFVLSRSQTTRKYEDALPEEIASGLCGEMGVAVGNFAQTGTPVSFIANSKTGYQIIMQAYAEASKKTGKKYHPMMNGAKLDIIEKGTLIKDFVADSQRNMTNSKYKESISEIINQVAVVDEEGNPVEIIKEDEQITKYSMFQGTYKVDPNKDTQAAVKKLMKKPDRSGTITVLGDYRVKSSYSIEIRDSLFRGQFWVKSDTHTFIDGKHEMRLELEFENLMDGEDTVEEKKETEEEE